MSGPALKRAALWATVVSGAGAAIAVLVLTLGMASDVRAAVEHAKTPHPVAIDPEEFKELRGLVYDIAVKTGVPVRGPRP